LFKNDTSSLSLPDYSVGCRQFHTLFESEPANVLIMAHLGNPLSSDMV
jgi:hypothetical protein